MSDGEHGFAGSPGFIKAIGTLLLLAGVAVAVLRYFAGEPYTRGMEGALGSAAMGAIVAAPGLLSFLALRDRPALLLPAALVLGPLSMLSLAGVLLPLLVPAAMLFIAYGRRSRTGHHRGLETTVVVLALLVAAVVVLFLREDPRSYTSPTSSGGTSDVISIPEALFSLALTTGAVVAGRAISTPRRRS